MGYTVVLLTEKKSFQNDEELFSEVDHFVYMPNLIDEKAIIQQIKELEKQGLQLCAVLSFIDPYVSMAAAISNDMGLTDLSVAALKLMENKIDLRTHLKPHESSPWYAIFQTNDSPKAFTDHHQDLLPFIIKPPISNGSKDVVLAASRTELIRQLTQLQKKYPHDPLLVEEFLEGPQYLVELFVLQEKIIIIGIIEQDIHYNGRFIVTGYSFPALLTEHELNSLQRTISSIVKKLGLETGSCHLEMKLVSGQWKLIEMNPRMSGGAMNRIIEEGSGTNLIQSVIDLHLGKKLSIVETPKQYVYAKYLTVNSLGKLLKVTGIERAEVQEGVTYVSIKPSIGSVMTAPTSMGHRHACIIAVSPTAGLAKQIALKAAKEIRFYIEPL